MMIPKQILESVRSASKDAARYQLTGIYLERLGEDECSATATDGKQLLHVRWKEEDWKEHPKGSEGVEGFNAILPTSEVKALKSMIPKCNPRPILEYLCLDESEANGKLPFSVTDLETTTGRESSQIQGTYPDYKWVLEGGRGFSIKFNPLILANLLTAVAKCSEADVVELQFSTDRKPQDHPVMVVAQAPGSNVKVTGMAMPLVKEKAK